MAQLMGDGRPAKGTSTTRQVGIYWSLKRGSGPLPSIAALESSLVIGCDSERRHLAF